MKRLSLMFLALLFISIGFGQKSFETDQVELRGDQSENWQMYFEHEKFKIEYRFASCSPEYGYDAEYCLLRFSNLSIYQMDISYHVNLYYADKCETCDYPEEYSYTLTLGAKESVEGTCSMSSLSSIKFFRRFAPSVNKRTAELTGFKLANLTVQFISKDS